jgi:hypothetical protein
MSQKAVGEIGPMCDEKNAFTHWITVLRIQTSAFELRKNLESVN